LVHPRVGELTQALDQVYSWNKNIRQEHGRQMRQLVERSYSWEVVGKQWLGLYARLKERSM
jgi:glycosyltransferase involved in cell wall biosynthesis